MVTQPSPLAGFTLNNCPRPPVYTPPDQHNIIWTAENVAAFAADAEKLFRLHVRRQKKLVTRVGEDVRADGALRGCPALAP